MSLTSQLADPQSPVTRFLDEQFPPERIRPISKSWYELVKPTSVVRPDMENPPWGTIGTAFDYRLRYFWAETPLDDLVAARGMRILDTQRIFTRARDSVPGGFLELNYPNVPPAAKRVEALLPEFADGLARTLAELAPVGRSLGQDAEALLCQHCYVLALFEQIFRAGPWINSPLYELKKGATLTDLLGLGSDTAIDDLGALSQLFYDRHGELTTHAAVLNPMFAGSVDFGGADADLIIENCLIELKTTTKPNFERKGLLYQLLGYVLLDYEDEYGLEEVGVYLARRGLLIRWQLESLLETIAEQARLPELRTGFKKAVEVARQMEGRAFVDT